MKKEAKKTNNPFKMIGSWIGLIVVWVYYLIFNNINPITCPKQDGNYCAMWRSLPWEGYYQELFARNAKFIILFILGFLIGWGIHYWYLKRKK